MKIIIFIIKYVCLISAIFGYSYWFAELYFQENFMGPPLFWTIINFLAYVVLKETQEVWED